MKSRYLIVSITTLLCFIHLGSASEKRGASTEIFHNWSVEIDLDEIDSLLKSAFETESGTIPQQALSRYLATMSSLCDSALFITYCKLNEKLANEEKEALNAEQAEWFRKREKLSASAGESEKGGSLAPAIASEKYIRFTRERNEVLKKRLLKLSGK